MARPPRSTYISIRSQRWRGGISEPLKRRGEVFLAGLRSELGAGHDANYVYFDPPKRSKIGMLIHLKDGSPLTIEYLAHRTVISPWLPAALAVQLGLLGFFTWVAVKLATQPLARLERAANSLGSDLRGELLPEDGPKEVARAATAFNAMQRRIAEQAAERIQILAGISRRVQNPITRMRLRADFLGDGDAKEKLQGDLQEMQTLVKQGLALARGRDESASSGARPTCMPFSTASSATIPTPENLFALPENPG